MLQIKRFSQQTTAQRLSEAIKMKATRIDNRFQKETAGFAKVIFFAPHAALTGLCDGQPLKTKSFKSKVKDQKEDREKSFSGKKD